MIRSTAAHLNTKDWFALVPFPSKFSSIFYIYIFFFLFFFLPELREAFAMLMWRSPSFSPSPSSVLPCVLWQSRWTCCLRKWFLFNAYVSRLPVCSFTFQPPLHTVPGKDKYALYTRYIYVRCVCSSPKPHVFCLSRERERNVHAHMKSSPAVSGVGPLARVAVV